MRYVTRQALRDAKIPKGAIILDETPQQIAYAIDGKIAVLRIFEVGSCEGCVTLYWASVSLVLVVSEVLAKMDAKAPSRKPGKKISAKKSSPKPTKGKNKSKP